MLGSRRGRPSLIGRAAQTAARTAVITATATTVAGKAAARQAPGAPTPAAEPPAPAPGGLDDEAIARLQKLAELHSAGILTAEEFAIQKARILA
jgi:Short C-terminal domain